MKREEKEPCVCEQPGVTYSGIKGIICCWDKGVPVSIERCDACQRFPDDDVAAMVMITLTELKALRDGLNRVQDIARELTEDRLRGKVRNCDNPWYKQVREIATVSTKALRLDHRIVKYYDPDKPPKPHASTNGS